MTACTVTYTTVSCDHPECAAVARLRMGLGEARRAMRGRGWRRLPMRYGLPHADVCPQHAPPAPQKDAR